MRRYEQIYILRPSLSEDEINKVIENTNEIIQNGNGEVIFLDKWGMRKLAYPIKKESQGYYILCDFAASPEAVAEIERKFRIDDAVIKYLSVKIADAITPEEIAAAQESAASQASYSERDEAEVEADDHTAKGEDDAEANQEDEDDE